MYAPCADYGQYVPYKYKGFISPLVPLPYFLLVRSRTVRGRNAVYLGAERRAPLPRLLQEVEFIAVRFIGNGNQPYKRPFYATYLGV